MDNHKTWQTKKIRSICDVFDDGDWIESKDQSSSGIRLIQTGNVGVGMFKNRGGKARYISESTFRRLHCREIFSGDTLVSRLPDPVGRACIIPDVNERMITAVDCTILRFNKELIPDFFRHYSQSKKYFSDIDKETSGTTRKRISRNKLGEIQISYPNISEQKRIVGILDKVFENIDKAKENTEKNLQNSNELFESYLQSIFINAPANWNEKKLGVICRIGDGNHSSNYPKKEEMVVSGVPFIRGVNLVEGTISNNDMRFISKEKHMKLKKGHLKQGDVLFTNRGEIGKIAIVDEQHDGSNLNSQIAWFRCGSEIFNKFLYYKLLSPEMKRLFSSTRGGTALQQFTIRQINKIDINFPPLSEQRTIVKNLDELSGQTKKLEENHRQKLLLLDELKKSILAKAFSGNL